MEVFQLYGCRYKRKKKSHHILTHPKSRYGKKEIKIVKSVGLTPLFYKKEELPLRLKRASTR
jgi:hypothetical protein